MYSFNNKKNQKQKQKQERVANNKMKQLIETVLKKAQKLDLRDKYLNLNMFKN